MRNEQKDDRYRRGICIDCGRNRHSAGRPRCNECHEKYVENLWGSR